MDWASALDQLEEWHRTGARDPARAAIEFIEPELRLMIPGIVRRSWPPELIEDALRAFLTKLLERPLPEAIREPRGFFSRSFRNHCIDIHRDRQRLHEESLKSDSQWASSPDPLEPRERSERAAVVAAAVDSLAVADRVALKLVDAPEWLSGDELTWLVARSGLTEDELLRRIDAAQDVYSLTLLFDPVTESDGPRRQRMERFRRRRARAREKVREALVREDIP